MYNKFLAINIGNTNTTIGSIENFKIKKLITIKTREISKRSTGIISKFSGRENTVIALISSTVPSASAQITRQCAQLNIQAYEMGKDLPLPIKNAYQKQKQVGIDRLVGAYAAFAQYKKELIVIDFGTAITFNVVSGKGAFLGGAIALGPEGCLNALSNATALLPKIRLKHPKNVIGLSTSENILIGCLIGLGGLCDRLIEELGSVFTHKPLVIATGGGLNLMRPYCRKIQKTSRHLVINGLINIYKHHIASNHQNKSKNKVDF